jgi:hypothetical protein
VIIQPMPSTAMETAQRSPSEQSVTTTTRMRRRT